MQTRFRRDSRFLAGSSPSEKYEMQLFGYLINVEVPCDVLENLSDEQRKRRLETIRHSKKSPTHKRISSARPRPKPQIEAPTNEERTPKGEAASAEEEKQEVLFSTENLQEQQEASRIQRDKESSSA